MADVAYVLPLFPKVSETFITNEVDRVQSSDIDVLPISIDASTALESTRHTKAEKLQQQTKYVMDYSVLSLIAFVSFFLVRSPLRLASVCWLNWRLGELPNASRAGRLFKTVIVAKLVVDAEISHVHGHWTLPSNTALLAAFLADRTFSFTLHAHDIYDDLPLLASDTGFPTIRYKVDRAEFIFTCTARNRDYLLSEYDIPAEKLRHVYHGVDLTQFEPSEIGGECDPPLILTIGRLVDYKGFDKVVNACGELRNRGYEFECRIVGDGTEYDTIQRQVERLGLDDVVSMPGYLPHTEVRDLYDCASVYVFVGSHEEGHYGLPNVLVESAAMGVPIVTTHMPAVTELVEDGTNGIIVDGQNPDEIAEAIGRLLDDGDIRERFGRRSRELVEEQFDVSQTVKPIVESFRHQIGS